MKNRQYILADGSLGNAPALRAKTFGFAEQRVLGLDEDTRTVEAVVSTSALDSYQEVVEPDAFKKRLAKRWNLNAPLIAGHVYHAEDGTPGKIGEWIEMGVREVPGVGRALVGKARIFSGYALADTCWQIIKQSQSVAFSVGWLTHAWEMQDRQIEGQTERVRVYTDVELIEVSFVTVPANPQAVVQAALAEQSEQGGGGLIGGEREIADVLQRLETQAKTLEEIKRSLDAEPGSKMHELVLSTCQQMRAAGSHGVAQTKVLETDEQDLHGDAGGHPVLTHMGF